MPRRVAFLIALLAAAPASADVVPGTPTPETEVRTLLGTWDGARVRRDLRVLDRLLASDFALVRADGRTVGRAAFLGRLGEPGLRLIEREDLRITIAANAATATSRVVRIGTPAGPDRAEAACESAHLRREGEVWRLVLVDASKEEGCRHRVPTELRRDDRGGSF